MIRPTDLVELKDSRETELYVVDTYNTRRDSWRMWRQRISVIDAIQRGEWDVEKPDGTVLKRKPLVENLLNSAIEETGRSAGEQVPSTRVEAATQAGEARAQLREQVLLYGHQLSNIPALLPPFYMHLAATGLVGVKVMPDFRYPVEKRFPRYSVVDPRGILPPPGWQFGQEPDDVVCTKVVKARLLKRPYPTQYAQLMVAGKGKINDSSDVTIIEFYSPDQIVCVAEGGPGATVTLYATSNTVGMIPVVLGARPTADGLIRGQFDHLIPPMLTNNRLMDYIAEYADQTVYSPVVKNFAADIDFGPGAVITTPEGGTVSRVPPAQMNPQLFAVQQALERAARRAGIFPEARAGDISQSIASAQFVESILGSFLTNLKTLQTVGEVVFQRANEVYLAQDRAYCDTRKSIVGYAQGGQFKTLYRPSEVIKDGEYGNIVSYGAGAGMDSLNASVRVLQWLGAGLGSKRWARENLDMKNFLEVERQIEEEFVQEAIKGLTLAQAQQLGNGEPLRAYLDAVMKDGNPLQAIEAILAATQPVPTNQPEAQNPAAAGLTQAPAQVRQLEKGGIPQQQFLPNPPLTSILVK